MLPVDSENCGSFASRSTTLNWNCREKEVLAPMSPQRVMARIEDRENRTSGPEPTTPLSGFVARFKSLNSRGCKVFGDPGAFGGPMMARRKISKHWFVSVEAPRQLRLISKKRAFVRQTKAFPTEREAKQFAKAMLSDGMKIVAGTLNPHHPIRRIISASEINQWIEEGNNGP
jgi:hypothetical protein